MLKLGIIGTNWITQQFVDAAKQTGEWQLTSVYSRTTAKAEKFGQPNGATEFYDNLEQFFSDGSFDAVYIASPNSLHFEQARLAIDHNKQVIVEKPIVANQAEYEKIDEALRAHPHVHLFEAARQLHEPNFQAVKEQIDQLPKIQGATLTYMKYSSRYDAVLAGEEPNVFSLKFAGGALQDLGVYVVYDAVAWFGMPDEVAYYPTLTDTRVDGKGVAILKYPSFEVTLNIGKTSNSYLPSEIYGLKDTIELSNPADLEKVTYHSADGEAKVISSKPDDNPMVSEARDFAAVINDPVGQKANYEHWLALSHNVNKLLFNLRQSGNIYFTNESPAD